MLHKGCIDDCLCLAIGDLTRLSNSLSQWDGVLKWTIRDRVVSEVAVKYKSAFCVLSYSCRGETNSQTIEFSETPCHFGGSRKWFVCSGCRKRVSKLRLFGMSFVCGKCIGLGYKSQRINKAERLQSRAAKIKGELGMDTPASLCRFVEDLDRPKGMHWSTFRRDQARANNYIMKAIQLW